MHSIGTTAARRVWPVRFAAIGSATLFTYAFVQTAWVVDDAYITFRTVDNFLHGYGLTWNVGERVQAYTHPLWMFLVSAAVALTREYFYTAIALSFACSAATMVIAWRHLARVDHRRSYVFLGLVVSSKAVMDYSSSGLENPLSYLLLVAFFCAYFTRVAHPHRPGSTRLPFLLASLAYVNRQDTLLLYVPALLDLSWREWSMTRWRAAGGVIVGTLPLTLWTLFSLFYYGFPFPNTAYAKLTDTALPLAERLQHGLTYLGFSLQWDGLGFIALGVALALALRRRDRPRLLALAGVCLYLFYVVVAGAGATHMIGRFVAAPLLLVFLTTADLLRPSDTTPLLLPVLAAYAIVNPVSPLKQNTAWYKAEYRSVGGYIDTVAYAHREGTGLFTYGMIPNACLADGFQFRTTADPLRVGGCGGTDPIGFFGFAAGPQKWVIDRLALSDAFLARLRPCIDFRHGQWKPGHYPREIPAGYLESVLSGVDALEDPALRELYAALASATRGPLLDSGRLATIVLLNAGYYDRLLSEYNRSVAMRARANRCQF